MTLYAIAVPCENDARNSSGNRNRSMF
jgi:hypothetical protein